MTDYKVILGILAVAIGLIGYGKYIRDALRGTTKPHVFSWLAWAAIEAIVFFAQIAKGGNAGAWVTGIDVVLAVFITYLAFRNTAKQIRPADVMAFSGAILGIILWRLTDNPLLAVILVSIADIFGFIPTFRKSYYRPYEETLVEYGLAAIKFTIALFALQSFNMTTALYPISIIATNSLFVAMTLIRRKKLKLQ